MGTKYHYDRNGRYKGMTTDKPPEDNGCIVAVVVLIILFCLFSGGC